MAEQQSGEGIRQEPPKEELPVTPVRSVSSRTTQKPHRLARIAAAVAAIGALASGSDASVGSSLEKPTQGEKVFPSWESVADKFSELQQDPKVDTRDSVAFAPLRSGLSEGDYKSERYKEARSADLLEVRYNKSTDELQFLQQSKGLDKNSQYDLLAPIAENQMILKTAFAAGDLDRVAMRALYPDETATFEDTYAGYSSDNPTRTQEVTVLFSGGNVSMRGSELKSTMSHEVIHALTAKHSLSKTGREPQSEDIATWKGICQDIRTIAINEAAENQGKILKIMENSLDKFPEPKAREALEQVYTDLKHADLDQYQNRGIQEDELSDCQTIGPVDAFWKVFEKKDPELEISLGAEAQEVLISIGSAWYDLIKDETIYKELREAAYGESEHSGHPFDDWDELLTSVSNIILLHPEKLAENIKKLPNEKREKATILVKTSMQTLHSQVPQSAKFRSFHQKLMDSEKSFITTLSS